MICRRCRCEIQPTGSPPPGYTYRPPFRWNGVDMLDTADFVLTPTDAVAMLNSLIPPSQLPASGEEGGLEKWIGGIDERLRRLESFFRPMG